MRNQSDGKYQFHTTTSKELPIQCKDAEIAFIGESVDDRGIFSTAEIKAHSRQLFSIKFDPEQQLIYLNETPINNRDLANKIHGCTRILIDATTVGLGEILHILLATKKESIRQIEFIYGEPKKYTQKHAQSENSCNSREYSLTHNCAFRSVQGFAHQYDTSSPASHVFMLGFEQGRILNAIEQRGVFDPNKYKCHFIIGVPAFKPGWESNSIRPHLDILEELKITERAITYCQANSIREAYYTLWDLYSKIGDERKTFYISPLGTKPHTIGAALFLFETKGNEEITSLYYDHPQRVNNRSREVERWHYIKVTMPA